MDNLKLIKQVVLQKSSLIAEARCSTVDPLLGIIWVATGKAIFRIHIEDYEIKPIGCLHEAEDSKFLVHCSGIAANAEIMMLDSVSSIESLCIAVNTGEVLLLHSNPYEIECVGCCDGGISCMSWSPDQELVLFVTDDHKLILMTKDFDIISEQSASQMGFGEAEPINVGWGKKETQFHGSLGKAAAQSKQQESDGTSGVCDNIKSYVSWRGDGQYFICSTIDSDTGKRLMRVWTRDLALHSTVESLEGLEYPLSWRPSGNLIVSVQRKPNKHDIVFFERNGLQHGGFTLPFAKDEMKVQQLLWNASSSVLGVWLEPLQSDRPDNHCVQLWTTSNYHWYLKMELNFTNTTKGVAAMFWDPVSQLKLHLITQDGQYINYDFALEVTQSEGSCHSNQASVVLIDGCRLLYTTFKRCVIPPPMCSNVLTAPVTPAAINQVTFSPCLQYMLVMLSTAQVLLYCLSQDESSAKDQHGFQLLTSSPYLVNSSSFPLGGTSLALPRHLTWHQEKKLLGIRWDMATQSDQLCQYRITHDDHCLTIDKIISFPCEQEVISVQTNSSKVVVQLNDGSVLEYSVEDGLMPWMLKDGSGLQLLEPCAHMKLAMFNGEDVVVGLSQTAKLYVNNIQLATNCSSFYVHDNFLLLTTHWHTLHCISLHQSVSELKLLTNENNGHENVRNVERGSKIVTAIASDTRVVLQMPRGNLETINPRALVLSHLCELLNNKKFGEAFMMMRKHRINMNLLYDHNPQMFLDNVTQFVQQLLAVGGLDLFLTELSDQDVTATMYTSHHQQLHNKSSTQSNACDSKIDHVCDAVLKCLGDLGKDSTHLLSTITALVKKTTPELETVLTKIKELQASGVVGNGVTIDDALKHLLFLVDVNQLYDVALGMYDFDMVLVIAEKSQKDPKEYLPFLNRLRKMDSHYQKYSIDCHLQRYSKALCHLSRCNSIDRFDEALSLIKAHHLYSLGLDLYSNQPEQHKTIAHEFGSYLITKKCFKEAVLMFRRAQDLSAALEACEGWGCWQQVFVLSAELYQSEEDKMALARRMADKLKQKRQYRDAAEVLSQYANDTEEGIVVLLEGGAWAEALCMAHQSCRTDLIQTNIEPAILEAHQVHSSTIESLSASFTQYSTRLSVVRKSKDANTRILSDGRIIEEKEDDLFSETSSVASLHSTMASSSIHSRTTAHSRKNRRKAEKKKYNLKEGSAYEDVALTAALADIVTAIDNMQSDIGELLTVLVQFNHDTLARQLQQVFNKLLDLVQEHMSTIWPPAAPLYVDSLTGPHSTVNSIVTGHLSANICKNDLPPAPSIKPIHWQLDFIS